MVIITHRRICKEEKTVHNKPTGTNSPSVALQRSQHTSNIETLRKLIAGNTTKEACTT